MDEELRTTRERLVGQIAALGEENESTLQPEEASDGAQASAGPVKPAGPPDRKLEDFAEIAHHNSRREAHKEYQRTLDEFRKTGAVADKTWGDFAHFINPPSLSAIVFQAHCDACDDIERWQEQQVEEAKAAERCRAERLRALREAEIAAREAEKQPGREEEETFLEEAEHSSVRSLVPDTFASGNQPALLRPSAPSPGGGLLRDVPFDPDAPGRMAPYEPAIPQLQVASVPQRLPAVDDQTEALLNAIIGECHFYMREVTFPSLCHARIADDRMGWISKAVQLAETGAKVGKAVARLRHGPDIKETRHTATIVQNRIDAGQRGGG